MTYSNGASARQLSYDAIIKKIFTKINDRPTRRKKDNLLVEVEKVLVAVSVPGFDWSSKYGLLAETRGGPAYEALSGKVYAHPEKKRTTRNIPIHEDKMGKWQEGENELGVEHVQNSMLYAIWSIGCNL